ncbi:MAG: hypothetical protein K2H12_12820 [Acetatifactor sp.]|nr:hypothetical protein [Acetatifactor sp.]
MPPEQADSAEQTVETESAEPDDSSEEESTGGQEEPESESAEEEMLPEEESIPAAGEADMAAPPEDDEEQQEEYIGSIEPELPATGTQLSDFVAEGWEIRDSVELDFNEDGIVDYVGVQEVPLDKGRDEWWNELSLRILFAIASDGEGQYRLDFQDANLIRARTEGGMNGDPYDGIEGSRTSFTTYASGGSSDKWSESYTYTYRDGTWYLTASEDAYGYAWNVDDYRKDDWDSGIRICKTRGRTSDQPSEIVHDPGVYELEYEMRLDEPLTLYQASRRWWLSQERITDWEVRDIVFAEGIELPEDRIGKPGNAYYYPGCMDENYALYTFFDEESEKDYLALYSWQDRTLTVLSAEESPLSYEEMDAIGIYQDKVYYSTAIIDLIRYKSTYKGETRIIEDKDAVGQKVVRMNLDGTGKETIFTYMYPGTDQPVLEKAPPYLGITDTQISGGEIVLGVYIGMGGGDYNLYYRMNVDGSELREMGQVSHEFLWEEE